jgi:hypothetical protein
VKSKAGPPSGPAFLLAKPLTAKSAKKSRKERQEKPVLIFFAPFVIKSFSASKLA